MITPMLRAMKNSGKDILQVEIRRDFSELMDGPIYYISKFFYVCVVCALQT